jgi:hypothetical protein
MRKTLLLLALGAFLSATSIANACDGTKTAANSKTHSSCCMKGKKAKACMTKNGKDCTKDPNCTKDMKASKTTPKKDAGKS